MNGPVGDPVCQEHPARASIETHSYGYARQETQQCASQGSVGDQRRIVVGAAQPAGEAKQFQGAFLRAMLVVYEDIVDMGIVPKQVRRLGPHDDADSAGVQPRPGRFEQRSGQYEVAHECGLYDKYVQPA